MGGFQRVIKRHDNNSKVLVRIWGRALPSILVATLIIMGCSYGQPALESTTSIGQILREYKKLRSATSSQLVTMLKKNRRSYLAVIAAHFHKCPTSDRATLINTVSILGQSIESFSHKGKFPWKRIVDNRLAIQILVAALKDSELDIRNEASRILAKQVPSAALGAFAIQIIEAVEGNLMSHEIALLGKTNSSYALKILKQNPRYRKTSAIMTRLALARLGDQVEEDYFLTKFRRETGPDEKAMLAGYLGYIATPSAIIHLARELRNPQLCEYAGSGRQTLRIPIVRALSSAMPENEVFWVSRLGYPRTNEYFAPIERWAETHLLIKWERPIPKVVLIRPPPHHLITRDK